MNYLIFILSICLVFCQSSWSQDAKVKSLGMMLPKKIQGGLSKDTCYSIHGRLQRNNGTPSHKIWIIGSTKMLGVVAKIDSLNEEIPEMPDYLFQLVDFDRYVFGDFIVCPSTKYRPGEMQLVRVIKATNLKMRLRK